MRCSPCGHENLTGAKFCSACGQALPASCLACQVALAPGVKFCGECGTRVGGDASGEQETAEVDGGERRQLTVLFCDLVGSTELSTTLDPEDLREVVRAYQGAAAGAVERFGGHVAQYLGDGILAYFGYPQAHDDDAERALRAGLAAVDGVKALRERLGRPLAVRVGVHTGPVVVGEMGAGARRETLALGETTNVAARLEGAAAPNTVVASGMTLRLARGIFVTEDLGALTLKGVPAPVPAHRVVQPSGMRSRLDVAAGRLTRFVGREVELATLVERWERAADGEGQNVLVVGEAGVGKSRLAYQLRERLATTPHTWLECAATPYTEGTPFHPVMTVVAQGLAFTATDTAAEKIEKIERGLRELATSESVALLADFLGLPPATPFTMNPDVQRRKTMELLAQWNLAISTIQPLVLLVEDLHWCDASSLELLGRIIAQSATARVLFVATARSEFTPPWPARSNLTTVQLARLTKRQAREMVTTLLADTLPAETVEALVARADGVPLYVEELTKAVAEPGAARSADAIPTTLAGSLMARLDRLSTAKEVAQRAAVLGREFGYPLLAAVAGMEDAGLRQGLARLVDAEIVFQRGEPPHATYTFKHALVQEAAYESLLRRARQQLHGRVVDVLREQFPERVASEPELVARHAEAAGRTEDAIAYHQKAGEQAQARSAHEEAIGHLRRAITVVATCPESRDRDGREAMLHLALSGSLRAARGIAHPDCQAAYERAQALAESAGDARRLGLALGGLASFWSNAGNAGCAAELAARVLTLAEETGDRELALLGNVEFAVAETWKGNPASSVRHFDAARVLYEERETAPVSAADGSCAVLPVSYLDLRVISLAFGSWPLCNLGWPDAAIARAREAVSFARDLDDPFNLAYALVTEAVTHWFRRDLAAVRERADEAVALSEVNGFPLWLGVGRVYHAAARVVSGDNAAVADILAGLAICAEIGNQGGASDMFAVLAEALIAVGQLADANGAVETGLALAVQTGSPVADSTLHRLHGEIALKMADGTGRSINAEAKGEECFRRSLEIARAQESRYFELRAATSLARLWRNQGKRAEARDLLAPIYEWFTEGFDTGDLIDAKALLDELR